MPPRRRWAEIIRQRPGCQGRRSSAAEVRACPGCHQRVYARLRRAMAARARA